MQKCKASLSDSLLLRFSEAQKSRGKPAAGSTESLPPQLHPGSVARGLPVPPPSSRSFRNVSARRKQGGACRALPRACAGDTPWDEAEPLNRSQVRLGCTPSVAPPPASFSSSSSANAAAAAAAMGVQVETISPGDGE